MFTFIKNKINELIEKSDKVTFSNMDNKIMEYDKLKFSSDVDLPLYTFIEFYMLAIVINCVIEKGNKYYLNIIKI